MTGSPGSCRPIRLAERSVGALIRSTTALAAGLLLAACATSPPMPRTGRRPELAYVITHGWHTDLALPAATLEGRLARLRRVYPGARTLIFGFGNRIFARLRDRGPDIWAEALLPMRGAIVVTAISTTPELAYDAAHVTRLPLPLPAGGDAALSAYLWNALAQAASGQPRLLGAGPYRGSVVYAATTRYSLIYTCNSWTIDGLRAAGLPVATGGVVFAGRVRRQIAPLAEPPISSASPDRAATSRPDR